MIEIPCGKVKRQESVFKCLRNKVLIETELEYYGNCPIVIDTFVCKADGEPVNESEEASAICWISLNNLKQMLQENNCVFILL